MSAAPANAGEAVLVAVQEAAPGLFRPFDAEQGTRFEAALEALAPNTRRAYGGALAAWGRWTALQGVHALAAPPFALRAYLRERASDGAGISSLRLTVAALRKLQALVGVEPTANDQVVTDTISGLARLASAPRQAYALTADRRWRLSPRPRASRAWAAAAGWNHPRRRVAAAWSTSRCAGCCRTRACAARRRPRLRGMTRRAGTTARAG